MGEEKGRKNSLKRFLLLIVILSLISCSSYKPKITRNQIEGYDVFEKVELELEFNGGVWPTVTVLIQGKEVKLEIDTGNQCSIISLSGKQISELDYSNTKYSNYVIDILGKLKRNNFYLVSELSIGDLYFDEIIVDIYNKNTRYQENYGNIGWLFLKEFNLLFDYRNKKFVLYNKDIDNDIDLEGWNAIHFNENPYLSFQATIGNNEKLYNCSFDTGAIALGKDEVYNLLRVDVKDEYISENKKTILYENDKFLLIENIELKTGESSITQNWLRYITPQPQMYDFIFGGAFFREHKVFIDNKNNILYYKKSD